ncbi:DUF1330 domain-containing protein [Aliiruegeria lutimaris]|uniref:Uncharacterized conserved protein, DUF1330 family n=1 Tax=Aliiruegeria lutimaris TaxID=571298 RepID=A0A1G9PA04_9RHOB|nr:DUF1330 domain-containing protein [Aliiruegeria lutimaris]SDL94985.1 Uncharacterized conserved protein, DUF1330 family [Aliiruegeria lutimaris]
MKTGLVYAIGLVAAFALGQVSANRQSDVAHAQTSSAVKAAYLIGAKSPIQAPPENMAKYRDVAIPLAQQAGLELLGAGIAGSTLQVLEGKWPYEGQVVVERYNSMEALLDFWNAADYQQLRQQMLTEANFIIAVEAVK